MKLLDSGAQMQEHRDSRRTENAKTNNKTDDRDRTKGHKLCTVDSQIKNRQNQLERQEGKELIAKG